MILSIFCLTHKIAPAFTLHNVNKNQFANMLLLLRMKEFLESLIAPRRSRNAKIYRYIPLDAYEKILEKIHLRSTGQVVDPFVSLKDRVDREERQRRWIENLNVVRYSEEDVPRLVAMK